MSTLSTIEKIDWLREQITGDKCPVPHSERFVYSPYIDFKEQILNGSSIVDMLLHDRIPWELNCFEYMEHMVETMEIHYGVGVGIKFAFVVAARDTALYLLIDSTVKQEISPEYNARMAQIQELAASCMLSLGEDRFKCVQDIDMSDTRFGYRFCKCLDPEVWKEEIMRVINEMKEHYPTGDVDYRFSVVDYRYLSLRTRVVRNGD